ncbi:MAG: hypothetical protein ACREH8_02215 [Opitutaceae bacterium]
MNLRVLLLLGFTALNSALIAAFILRPSLVPPAVRSYLPQRADTNEREAAARAARAGKLVSAEQTKAPVGELWTALHSSELAALVQRLRAAGFPPTMVRAIVDAEVERQFSPRIKELMRTVTDTPYWKQVSGYYMGNSKLFESINQIYRERSRVLRDLLGKDAYAFSGVDPTAAQRRQYGNLPQARIDLVQRITEDYAEMTSQVRSAMQGVTLPEDREKLALLEREKRADLAAILTPEEFADFERRTSTITGRLRTTFTIMDASEAEFRTIFKAHEPFKDALYPTSGGGITYFGSDVMEKRREATAQINEQLKAALGDARFAEYQRSTDSDFQQLYRLGQRDNVPYETLVRAHDVRIPTAEASMKIVEDRSLSNDARRAALKELAQSTRTTLLSTLGPAAGPAYVDNSRWLVHLDNGRGISINPDGSVSSRSTTVTRPPAVQNPKR